MEKWINYVENLISGLNRRGKISVLIMRRMILLKSERSDDRGCSPG